MPPELPQSAEEAIAAGGYRNVSELVAAGVSLRQRMELARTAFNAPLEEAEAEGVRDGFFTIDDAHAEMQGIIDEARDVGGCAVS